MERCCIFMGFLKIHILFGTILYFYGDFCKSTFYLERYCIFYVNSANPHFIWNDIVFFCEFCKAPFVLDFNIDPKICFLTVKVLKHDNPWTLLECHCFGQEEENIGKSFLLPENIWTFVWFKIFVVLQFHFLNFCVIYHITI